MSRDRRGAPRFFRPQRPAPARREAARPQSATVRGLSDEGRGIAQLDGDPRPLFVAGALPGETVTLRVQSWHRGHGEAELLAVTTPSADRIAPRCAHFDACGGCQLQMLDHAAQLAHKQAVLTRLLEPFGPFAWQPALTAAPWHYRHRARVAVATGADGRPQVGFRGAHSHRVATVDDCPVLDPRLAALLPRLPGWLANLRHWQRLRELRLAVDGAGAIALGWSAEPALSPTDERRLVELLAAAGVRAGPGAELLYRLSDVDDGAGVEEGFDVGKSAGATREVGVEGGDMAASLSYRFGVDDFTQVNPVVNRQLVRLVTDWLAPQPGERIVDAFCGLGNFSLPLAVAGATVVGIEGDAAMVARAAGNAERAGLAGRLSFRAADLFVSPALPRADKLLLDPPRAGARALCATLAAAASSERPARVAYVSCNPHTLARDLGELVAGCYRVDRAALVDMFPHTGHIETAVLLTASDR